MNVTEIIKFVMFVFEKLNSDALAELFKAATHAIQDLKQIWQFVADILDEFDGDDDQIIDSQLMGSNEVDANFEQKVAVIAAKHPEIVERCKDGFEDGLMGAGEFFQVVRFVLANRKALRNIVKMVRELLS
jgi:Asp-tRNA(Asn)/Glu-tRNA(Gln) amidotransferase B subunit